MRTIKISEEIKDKTKLQPPAISRTSYQIIRLKLVKILFQLGEHGMFLRKTGLLPPIRSRWLGILAVY